MSVKNVTEQILNELTNNLDYLNDEQLAQLEDAILAAPHIFLSGAGRSGVAIRAFANRLLHLGKSVSLIGEITAPHTKNGDLLIIGSGSGETDSLLALAEKAKKNHLKLALVTMDPASSIGKIADTVVTLPGVSPKVTHQGHSITSFQPMGNAFEQMSFLVYDAVIIDLMSKLNETSDSMFERHANLE